VTVLEHFHENDHFHEDPQNTLNKIVFHECLTISSHEFQFSIVVVNTQYSLVFFVKHIGSKWRT
jgi:hypothetical protein